MTDRRTWLLTGSPGIGKSTIVSKAIYLLRARGTIVGGCITKEVRVRGERKGFELEDLLTGEKGELASLSSRLGPRVGRYRVNLQTLSGIGAKSLSAAASRAELIAIDEVGPMELTSPEFRKGATECLSSGKPLLAVVHENMDDPLIGEFKKKGDPILVTLLNRDRLAEELAESILSELSERPI
jgi:nucleoside-triphosphatase